MDAMNEAKRKHRRSKKPYSSMTITTGDIQKNIDFFNKRMGTYVGNDNNNPSTEEAKAAASEATSAISGGEATAATDGGVSGGSLGGGEACVSGGESGGMGEALEKKDIDFLVKDEEEAIKGYEDKINVSDSDAEKEVLAHIRDEEKEHIDELNDLADITAKAEEERSALTEAHVDPADYFDQPWELQKISDSVYAQFGLDKKDYVRKAWANYYHNKKAKKAGTEVSASEKAKRAAKEAEDEANKIMDELKYNDKLHIYYIYVDEGGDRCFDTARAAHSIEEVRKAFGFEDTYNTSIYDLGEYDDPEVENKLKTKLGSSFSPIDTYVNDYNKLPDSKKLLKEAKSALTEATKRYVKRYYIRPQNIVCSNKEEILKALVEIGDENCSVYSLKSLSDHDDVHKLTPSDIIYYYDDGIIYDKNHVKLMDYDLSPKHEEERKKFSGGVDGVTDSEFAKEYDDRLTDADLNDDDIKVSESLTEDFKFTKELTKEDADKLVGISIANKDGKTGTITATKFDPDTNSVIFQTNFENASNKWYGLGTIMYKDIMTSDAAIWKELKKYVTSSEDESQKARDAEAAMTDEERLAAVIKYFQDYAVELYTTDKNRAKNVYKNFKHKLSEPWPYFLQNDKLGTEAFCAKYEELKAEEAESGRIEDVKGHARRKIADYSEEAIKLSLAFKGTTKEWFSKYVRNIKFFIPDTTRVSGHAPKSLFARLKTLESELDAHYPGITKDSRHFALQPRGMESNKANYGWWGLVCEVYFTVPVRGFPKDVRELVEQCIEKSQAAGHDAKAVDLEATKISNVYLGFTILDMFDNDYTAFDDDSDFDEGLLKLHYYVNFDVYPEAREEVTKAEFFDCLYNEYFMGDEDEDEIKECKARLQKEFSRPNRDDYGGSCTFETSYKPLKTDSPLEESLLTENAHYVDSYKGYDIYWEEDGKHAGEYWCQKGYTDQCWDMYFNSKSELKAYIDKNGNSSYDYDEFEEAFGLTFPTAETLTEAKHEEVCCICGEEIEGYGNNAEPYKKGKCCDACNVKFVLPARMNTIEDK